MRFRSPTLLAFSFVVAGGATAFTEPPSLPEETPMAGNPAVEELTPDPPVTPGADSPLIAPVPSAPFGTWVADNGAFKNETDTMDAYGIEWTWGLGEKSLVGRLYGIRDGQEVGTFWQFREFWHPGKAEVLTTQFGSDGSYGEGPSTQTQDGTIEMLQTFYDPTTGGVFRVGHRSTLEGDLHTTRSFDVSDGGVWTERRTYLWRRRH